MERKYFFENQPLNRAALTNSEEVVVDKSGRVVGINEYDIALKFTPVGDDADFKEWMGKDLVIETGADEITWGYGMNTKRIPTYGGEVVQILSTFADKMTIKGTCRNYHEMMNIAGYFHRYLKYTTGWADKQRHQKFLKFVYPARKWSFVIMVTDIDNIRFSRDIAAPVWSITAEIVSENDRYALGEKKTDQWASVLDQPINAKKFVKVKRTVKGPKNFRQSRSGDAFGNLMEFADGRRGKIAQNFDALVASWATGGIEQLQNNPLVDPVQDAQSIYEEKFGGSSPFAGGSGSSGSLGSDNTTPVFGNKQKVFGTTFGGAGDDNGIGYKGDKLEEEKNWYSYAELSTNQTNGPDNNYNALGDLPYETPIKVTYKGKTLTLYKRDVGFGGPGPDQQRGTDDDPKIDIWHKAADELGFNGWDWLEIEIGTPGGKRVDGTPSVGGDVAYPVANPVAGEWSGGVADHMSRQLGNWESDNACDLMRPTGTPVYAVADGEITNDGFGYTEPHDTIYGARLHLQTKYGYFFYQHMQRGYAGPHIKQGAKVKKGDLLGYVEDGGLIGCGSHLHFGMKEPGNPETFLAQVYEKVKKK